MLKGIEIDRILTEIAGILIEIERNLTETERVLIEIARI